MKKVFIILIMLILVSTNGYTLETGLFEMRKKISAESKQIKAILLDSKDVVLLNSMWDSCLMTMTQLDAYFYLVGIFNSVKNPGEETVNYLLNWLKIIKSTSELNIKSLDLSMHNFEPKTNIYKEKLRKDFSELNKYIDSESNRISVLKKVKNPGKRR